MSAPVFALALHPIISGSLLLGRQVGQVDQGAELVVDRGRRLQSAERHAVGQDHAAPDRAVGVQRGIDRCPDVVQPQAVEQETLARALGVVGESVEQLVEDVEGLRQLRRGDRTGS